MGKKTKCLGCLPIARRTFERATLWQKIRHLLSFKNTLFTLAVDTLYLIFTFIISIEIPLGIYMQYTPKIWYIVIVTLTKGIKVLFLIYHILCNYFNLRGDTMSSKNRMIRYFCTLFIVDIIIVIPFDLVFYSFKGLFASEETFTRWFHYIRLIYLLGLIRIPFLYRVSSIFVQQEIYRTVAAIKFIFFFLFATHVIALISFPAIVVGELNYYLTLVYWTTQTLTTVGYGDIVPKTTFQQGLVILIMIAAVTLYSLIVGWNINKMFQQYARNQEDKDVVTTAISLCNYYTFPPEFAYQMVNYINKQVDSNIGDYENCIKDLPLGMQQTIREYAMISMLKSNEIFRHCSDESLVEIGHGIESVDYDPDDVIFHMGERANFIYFILVGKVQFEKEEGELFHTTESGYFGAAALFPQARYIFTTIALDYTTCYRLSYDHYVQTANHYPELKKKSFHAGHSKYEKRKEDGQRILKELGYQDFPRIKSFSQLMDYFSQEIPSHDGDADYSTNVLEYEPNAQYPFANQVVIL